MAGAGTVTLGGYNTFSGGLTTSGIGTLNINNGGGLAANGSALGAAAGTLTIAAGTALGNTSGAGVLVVTNNPQTWNGSFSFAGPNALSMGSGAVAMNANTIITVNSSTLIEGGIISGTGMSLTKAGAGDVDLGWSERVHRRIYPQCRNGERKCSARTRPDDGDCGPQRRHHRQHVRCGGCRHHGGCHDMGR